MKSSAMGPTRAWILLLILAVEANATIRYVKPGASGTGADWANPGDLQTIINNSSAGTNDEVWVAFGTYKPANQTSSIALASGIKVKGGFRGIAGDENIDSPTTRPPDPYQSIPNPNTDSILSGDLGTIGISSDNAYIIVTGASLNTNSLLDGFTITGGNNLTSGVNNRLGAGIKLTSASKPTIQNCRFIDNNANGGVGGAIYCSGSTNPFASSPTLLDCLFESNVAGGGGAVFLASGSPSAPAPRIERCTFVNNASIQVSGGANGGGAISNSVTTPSGFPFVVDRCYFIGNTSQNDGGGAIINANTSSAGAMTITNSVFSQNVAQSTGGGIQSNTGAPALTMINCTFAGNKAASSALAGGAVRTQSTATCTITNCIFWGNIGLSATMQLNQINYTTPPIVSYCDIEGLIASGVFDDGVDNTNNIGTDPVFANAPGLNFRIRSTSPCLNNGLPGAVTTANDLDGRTRVVTTVDRGAYEYNSSIDCQPNTTQDWEEVATGTVPDCNQNGRPDSCDIACVGSGTCGAIYGSADCNSNNVPDECEIASGTSQDCNANGIPDECEFADCNRNCTNDSSEINPTTDCNDNDILDECEVIGSRTWTSDSDFDDGTLINVNYATSGQLKRNTRATTAPLPSMWVAADKDFIVYRISTTSGTVVGAYHSSPSTAGTTSYPDTHCDRSVVDLDGSAWIANPQSEPTNMGSVVKVGVVIGGTRVNADGAANATGGYLKPPFIYCNCEDRDGDGMIRTSRGSTDAIGGMDILKWEDWDGANTDGGISRAEDECILRFIRTTPRTVESVAVDADNNLWVGGSDANHRFEKLDGFSGSSLFLTSNLALGGFGSLVNCGTLWSVSNGASSGALLRLNVSTGAQITPNLAAAAGNTSYAMTLDTDGKVWFTDGSNRLKNYTADGSTSNTYAPVSGLSGGFGVAARPADNHIWIADNFNGKLVEVDNSGTPVMASPYTISSSSLQPAGVSIDSAGVAWVASQFSGASPKHDVVGFAVGTTAKTVTLRSGADPFSVGDMTGMTALLGNGIGTWSVVHDGIGFGTEWCRVNWNTGGSCTQGDNTSLQVSVRASDYELMLPMVPFVEAINNSPFADPVKGRYVQIRVRFIGACPGTGTDATPALCDLTIYPTLPCIKGDVNGDGIVNGDDIKPFITRLLNGGSCGIVTCQADMNNSSAVDLTDVSCFADVLLGFPNCSATCQAGGFRTVDCNGNSVNDAEDIAAGTSTDCNHNYIPDECDIDANDPDGNELVSADVNANSIPDECEPDCNVNSVPDAWDITQMTSADVNTNGVPDECEPDCNNNNYPDDYDIAMSTSADCNINGIPDECETDCNENGVPDDCDIDPADPDGNQQVSADCNADGMPDECNLTLPPPYGSFDCNENGILDECDIASAFSEDANENGIPDECEESGLFGGDSMMGGSEQFPVDEEAAWEAFYEWSFSQCWGPQCALSPSEQFQLYLDKLAELGLPVEGSWSQP